MLFNVPSDIPVIGMGVSQPLGGSGVALTRYMALQKQAISAHEWALSQLSTCFEFLSKSEKRDGHKICAL